jgi:streptomycin 3"-adenylyltransferase
MKTPRHLESFFANLCSTLTGSLGGKIIGVYIHGSLSYGGYIKERSDIDILVIVNQTLDNDLREKITNSLGVLSEQFPNEVKNLELDILLSADIEKRLALLSGQYTFMDNHPVAPETLVGFWIELANTRENGIVLCGPEPKSVISEIGREMLIHANKEKLEDLQKNAVAWEKIDLCNQVYLLTQASRVLYSLENALKLSSKQDALAWAVKNVPARFVPMLQLAQGKLDNDEGPREQVISDNYRGFFRYVEDCLQRKLG